MPYWDKIKKKIEWHDTSVIPVVWSTPLFLNVTLAMKNLSLLNVEQSAEDTVLSIGSGFKVC